MSSSPSGVFPVRWAHREPAPHGEAAVSIEGCTYLTRS